MLVVGEFGQFITNCMRILNSIAIQFALLVRCDGIMKVILIKLLPIGVFTGMS
jgi:hypothetical protein